MHPWTRTAAVALTAITLALGVLTASASGAPVGSPLVADTQTLTAPDPNATEFGSGFFNGYSLDEQRAVVSARLGSTKVVYVFDRQADGSWSHRGTIPAPSASTRMWGRYVAVSGDTIAIADPEGNPDGGSNSGEVDVFDRQTNGTWTRVQQIRSTETFVNFAYGVWLTRDVLVIDEQVWCDEYCWWGSWQLYERSAANQFAPLAGATGVPGFEVDVGIDAGRLAITNEGVDDVFCDIPFDANLRVWDTDATPAAVVLHETVPCQPVLDDFRRVDVAGDVLVTETCCEQAQQLEVRRDNGQGYVDEATIPTPGLSDALVAVPDVILRADRAAGVFHTHVYARGQWSPSDDVAFPQGVVLPTNEEYNRRVVAAGPLLALPATNSVVIVEVVPGAGPPQCLGLDVTVDLAAGQTPTVGNDVILGTAGNDLVDALLGNDVVCTAGGNDLVGGERGNDIIDGGPGTDWVVGGAGNDIVTGSDHNDAVVGGDGADWVFGGVGDDQLFGGPEADLCIGQAGVDTARNCERTGSIAD